MTGMKALTAISAAAVVLLVPSCTRIVYDARALPAEQATAGVVGDENDCTPVDVRLATIPTDAGEPVLKIPQPPGWERLMMMDSELIRYTIRNGILSANAVVTVESAAGTSDPDETSAMRVARGNTSVPQASGRVVERTARDVTRHRHDPR